ncbi:iron complex transport system permease protein [Nannocystis exedens]|uniref:Iron complex transport system permease protein n=1 Tax=Nannocystis exedens TaxID=54 RepID=A0A1I1Z0P2_9BACT|nr:iron ABC transporter permease [Nannocystis exedens]PCC75217.1 iron ABC transporter [Nannocystis exedens]SFE25385.1 iron complex transport system permease protein [Nannocystis exedens]
MSAGTARRVRPVLLGLAVLVVLGVLLELAVGAASLDLPRAVACLVAPDPGCDPGDRYILLALRVPRALGAVVVGAGLAVAGCAMQGLFRNPLADPTLVGVSSGAALGAGLAIVFARLLPVLPGGFTQPVLAFAGGLAATWLVHALARARGQTSVVGLLLAGIAVTALAGSALGLLSYLSDDRQLRDLSLWLLGGLGGITRGVTLVLVPLVALAGGLLWRRARDLDALLLGEAEAFHLGVDVERLRRRVIIEVALAVGVCVAFTGIIGFVGLVVPHLLRGLVGPRHRVLLPAAALGGAGLLLFADAVARTMLAPAELPVGILTSLLGAPVFLALLARVRATELV